MKTDELTGAALNWAVSQIEGYEWVTVTDYRGEHWRLFKQGKTLELRHYQPSANWSIGGAIIERERISVVWNMTHWVAWTGVIEHKGETPLIAAMRCYVSGNFGGEIDIPEEVK